MKTLNAIAVFCGSSEGTDQNMISDAKNLGSILASQNISLIYGAAKIGLMGIVADAVIENSGKAIGVIPEFLKLKEVVHTGLDEIITTKTMHERKLIMHELSDGFIAIPGGFGTFEELFEITTWAQLGLHQKPIGLLNSNGFYNALIDMFKTMVEKGFLKRDNLDLIIVDDDINRLLKKMTQYKPQPIPKWLNAEST